MARRQKASEKLQRVLKTKEERAAISRNNLKAALASRAGYPGPPPEEVRCHFWRTGRVK